jgi:hypothetical protein
MITKTLFVGRVARIDNGRYIVIIGDTTFSYSMKYYRHMEDLELETA